MARLGSITLDCDDPAALATFWSTLLGGEITYSTATVAVARVGDLLISATRVEDYRPPTWPEDTLPKQIHLDLGADDLDAAEAEAVLAGATPVAKQPAPDRFRVLLDPAGHPFCLTLTANLTRLGLHPRT
ncbi:Predicted enzyme related to lactoylglutathione lyase [Nocardia otitidiscaviarum]|uniref:Predicted enzyme related to lactoylglutathione lyase n=1 Tax=Nocardia otitidiscaviarum TaxID=1823 RepID=A0A378YA09_9NOCA|nr:VOC family protein [Nocardia otitidiscaviarum]SUA73341.1 Predicted enzyme related to lactoylglutathione lyase [Nocardia otitidiscaviarum]